ncbi:glycosyltransferase family 4 protein [Pseudomonas protegens]|jgi:glycosyltransferase involved in cell wall biosynthesis|uniref:glycosyltransferase family 4 protein n=1 Tax=Pseudomonas TaxID=286 RepID=UPI0014742101|nr:MULTISPECIES: glycosyltransferase family 4 protein [Pseudomonas]MBB1612342.1 glycosyl transferase family 1 [Pseudomonas sp. UMC65]MBB1622590.1 glycosyl transferase family 1 [Pseudomonas sp. UME65]MBF0643159.1 glycosyltransferase family 4 protein [Pseudomonas protegens]MCU1769247.1 glycosyltransferase family 4 protein [Pseudomonas protegens]NMZ26452.1 glycosyltransferase family 4 protein [Pseudomonas protegens]
MAAQPIVHLIHSGGFYGAERMLLDHCLGTPGQHRVVFINAPDTLLQRFAEAGVASHNCHCLQELLAHLRQQPGLLNAHNFKAQVFAWVCARRLRLPLVMTQHGFTPRSLKQKLYTWLSLRLCRSRRVRRVACVAQSIALLHLEAGVAEGKLRVIPNGLPEPALELPASLDGPPLREPEVRRDEMEPLVGFVGRLSAEKGPDLFLDALIGLCQQRPALKAVLLGDGEQNQALRERINEAGLATRILLPGYQNDMQPWLKRLNVLVLSSRTEGTPMILLEAMQAGTPVVAFAVGGIPDVLQHRHNGLLAKPLDSAGLGRCIGQLLDDPVLAGELAKAAQVTQRKHYHLPTLARRWDELYRVARESSRV